MKKIKNSKLLLKILSALIAIVLWFAITYTEDPAISQTLSGVNLDIIGEDILNSNGFAIVNKEDFPAINVIIRGSRSNVISALGSIHASIDVSSIKRAGTSVLSVSYSYPSNHVVLEKAKVKELSVETEVLVTREIPVKLEVTNSDKNSDILVKAVNQTKTVTVSGAENAVYNIAYAKARVDISKISKTSTQECIYEFYSEKGEPISEKNLVNLSRQTITVESTVYKKTELALKAVLNDESRADYGIAIKNMEKTTVSAGLDDGVAPEYIEAVITPQKDNSNTFEARLNVPDGVYIPEEALTVIVTGEILPKELREITAEVTAVNQPVGKRAVISPAEKTVTLKTIENASDIKLSLTVDVGEMTENEQIMPVTVSTDSDVDLIGTYSVMVKMESEE